MLAILVTGCATSSWKPADYSSKVVNAPSLNVESQAEVGQSMVSTAMKTTGSAISIDHEIVPAVAYGLRRFTLTIPAGILRSSGSDANGEYYQSATRLSRKHNFESNDTVIGGVFIPYDTKKPSGIYWEIAANIDAIHHSYPGIDYKTTTYEEISKTGFKRELVYSGVSQNTISILYREFQSDMARPAFSQELKYDLAQGSAIGYKGARFEVIKANNTGIVYKVLKALD